MEPYVFYLIKRMVCNKSKVDKVKVSSEALCSLTSSALNVELVYAIISGINSIMKTNNNDNKSNATYVVK